MPHLSSLPAWTKQLHWQILLGLVLGLVYALSVRYGVSVEQWAPARAPFEFLGELFIRALKMIIVPLIVVSIVSGIQQIEDTKSLGKLGGRTMLYYMLTTFFAVSIGLLVVNVLEPGVGLNLTLPDTKTPAPTPLSDVFMEIIPNNILEVWSKGKMLPTIFVSVLAGIALLSVGEIGRPLVRLVEALNAVVLKVTDWIMRTAPIGVAALFIQTLLDPNMADLGSFFANLGGYMVAVVAGLGLHAVVVLPLMLWIVTKRSPIAYARALSAALLTAFSTASSSATYPVTLECVTDNAGVSKQSANVVLPLGATINMDGTALYEAVAAVFIANALGIDLSFGQQLIILFTATLAAIGAAGVPSAGLVTMIIVLESVGLPGAAYGLVVAVDRILDQCRTTVNVWGDAIGAAIVDHGSSSSHGAPEPAQGSPEDRLGGA